MNKKDNIKYSNLPIISKGKLYKQNTTEEKGSKLLTTILIIAIISVLLFCGYSMGKSIEEFIIKSKAEIAEPILVVENNSSIDITALNNTGTYTFKVKNYNEENQVTQTDLKYYDEADGTVKYIECGECDYVTLEFRPDNSVKKVTYDVKQISYDSQSFDSEDYEFPSSLKNTKDLIKIYINGILYDGTYTFKDGVLSLDKPVLNVDPIELYFNSHPYEYKIWKNKNGEYVAPKDRVTFEWR